MEEDITRCWGERSAERSDWEPACWGQHARVYSHSWAAAEHLGCSEVSSEHPIACPRPVAPTCTESQPCVLVRVKEVPHALLGAGGTLTSSYIKPGKSMKDQHLERKELPMPAFSGHNWCLLMSHHMTWSYLCLSTGVRLLTGGWNTHTWLGKPLSVPEWHMCNSCLMGG